MLDPVWKRRILLFMICSFAFFQNCSGKFAPQNRNLLSTSENKTPDEPGQPPDIADPIPAKPIAPATSNNSLDTLSPSVVIPAEALIPDGIMETRDIPSTIDLAEMAALYLEGISKTLLPEENYFSVPPGQVNMHSPTPTLQFKGGAPNWGKTVQAMVMARRMSGHDLNNALGTMTRQLQTTRNMIDPNVNRNLIDRGEGSWHAVTGANPENQMTTTVEALIELYKQYPGGDLRQLIQQMITYHTAKAQSGTNDNGEPMMHYRLPEPGVGQFNPNSIGTLGYGDWPFHVGKTMRALSTWFLLVNDLQALSTTTLLSNFIRNYSGGLFWRVPAGFPENPGEGHFAGHIHMFSNGLMGILWEAEARLKNDPTDAFAWTLIEFVKKSYFFIRTMHAEAATALGNFGEICQVANMLRLAVKLNELGAGDFSEDIERWTRNQIYESQIRGEITIVSHPGDPLTDKVGEKVIGLFFEDATHALAIPDRINDQGSLTLQLVACGLGNVIHGIYDVWEHIVRFKKNIARINLLMNRTTWFMDIESEIPYRGVVHVKTRTSLGPINIIEMRIPDGVRAENVQVSANGVAIQYSWNANYVRIPNARPNTHYVVRFPLPFREVTIRQVRNQNQNWAESSYSPDPGNGLDYGFHEHSAENIFIGTLRGNTLMGLNRRPSYGIQLYRPDRNERSYLDTLGAADVPATATYHRSGRFRIRPDQTTPMEMYFARAAGSTKFDLITRGVTTGTISLWPSKGHHLAAEKPFGVLPSQYETLFADVNGDGKDDLIGRNLLDGAITAWLSTGTALGASYSYGVLPAGYDIYFADMNGDGKSDLVAREVVSGTIQAWLSTGTGISAPVSYGNLPSSYEVYFADITGDGKSDLIARRLADGSIQFWQNSGSGNGAIRSFGALPNTYEVYFQDFNGDGKADLIGREITTGAITGWASSGAGLGALVSLGYLPVNSYQIKFADVTGDGKADMVGRDLNTGTTNVWVSNGSGWASNFTLAKIR